MGTCLREIGTSSMTDMLIGECPNCSLFYSRLSNTYSKHCLPQYGVTNKDQYWNIQITASPYYVVETRTVGAARKDEKRNNYHSSPKINYRYCRYVSYASYLSS